MRFIAIRPLSLRNLSWRKRIILSLLGLELMVLAGLFLYHQFKPAEQLLAAASLPGPKPELTIEIDDEGVQFSLNPLSTEVTARLVLSTVAGPYVSEHLLNAEGSSFSVPYLRAGKTPYSLELGQATFTGTLERIPGPAVTPLEPLLTAKSARVTNNETPAVIVQPLDKNQNVNTNLLTLRVVNPDQTITETRPKVASLYSWSYLPPSRTAGKQYIIAETPSARGERAELDLLPGEVARADFQAVVASAPASGRDTWNIRLNLPRDKQVNRIIDGSSILFYGKGNGLDFFATRPLNQGESNLILPTYPQAGQFAIRSQSGSYVSDTVKLTALALSNKEIAHHWLSLQPLTLELGPVFDTYGAIPDTGSEVKIDILDEQGTVISQLINPLEAGKAIIVFPPLPQEASSLEFRMAGELIHLNLPDLSAELDSEAP